MKSVIDTDRPYWEDYRELLGQLAGGPFPDTADLNRLLPRDLCSLGGPPIRFTPAGAIPGVQYENHIYTSGQVSTREDNWHDLFNALVWCRWPHIKLAMNALHVRHESDGKPDTRGKLRDALTLLDESGAIAVSSDRKKLGMLARREWSALFQSDDASWNDGIRIFLSGHSLLEKFIRPYKSITAHTLLLYVSEETASLAREALITALDEMLADRLLDERLFPAPSGLSPLPLMGIPGWWAGSAQDRQFYADNSVFRAAPANFQPPPILRV